MTWKTRQSSVDPKKAERRLRTISQLRHLCLSLARAKKESDAKGGGEVRPLSTRKLSRKEEDAILAQLEREAAEAARQRT